jgi:galactokinase
VRAPGRVNLIGEHTDYNDGFVMPLAIDRATWIALRPRTDGQVVLYSLDHQEELRFAFGDLHKNPRHWGEYPKGVAWALQQADYSLGGWEGVTICDVPMGGGLSSSASFELATALAFQVVSRFPWEARAIAKICQRAENQWVGVNCGIMDQMISASGKAGHALLIDCRSLETTAVPLPAGTVVAVLDTGTRHKLSSSAYNERRSQCEAAAKTFGVRALRDVGVAEFERRAGELDEVIRARARHVVTENERTLTAARTTNPVTLGQLMNASHKSLRDDYEVSSKELNVFVECARALPGCYGARMTGAGFGGCAVALVRADAAAVFVKKVAGDYQKMVGIAPQVFICQASNGAEITNL